MRWFIPPAAIFANLWILYDPTTNSTDIAGHLPLLRLLWILPIAFVGTLAAGACVSQEQA